MGRVSIKQLLKSSSIGGVFFRYLLVMTIALLTWSLLMVGIFLVLIQTNFIYPSNMAELQINESIETIKSIDKVTEDVIPDSCRYIVYDKEGNELAGNLIDDKETVWNGINSGYFTGKYFYKIFVRDKDYVVLQYRMAPQFRSRALRDHLPNPEVMLTMIIIAGCIVIIYLSSMRFGRKIKKKMDAVMTAAEKIGKRDLDFSVSYSGIKEIDECLRAIDDMKTALKESLNAQWAAEQEKIKQMSALAHDIKTPLTVVRGNSELLLETELSDEQKGYAEYIAGSTAQISNYLQTLMEVTKEGCEIVPSKVSLRSLLDDIKNQAEGLLPVFHQKISWKEQEEETSDKIISVSYDQLVRAVMNIVRNAAEHTPEGGEIRVNSYLDAGKLHFVVEDSGSGFSPEALSHGTEQFFMDDMSRSSGTHYGIGLYFAKKTALHHGGTIELTNSEETGGGKVDISFGVN